MRTLTILLIVTFLSTTLHAQMDAKITTGVVSYNQGDFKQAQQNLSLALKDPAKVKVKNRAKGWYYLGKSAIAQYKEEMRVYKEGSPIPDPRLVLQGIDAFQQGLKLKDEKYQDKLLQEIQFGQHSLLQLGLQYMNAEMSKEAMLFLQPAADLNNGVVLQPNHVAHDLLGQVHMMEKDSAAALAQFKAGLDLIDKHPPLQGDVLCGYMAYRAALIKRYAHYDNESALEFVRKGKDLTGREWLRIGNGEAKYSGELKDVETQYNNTMSDLQRFELDILLNSGAHVEEALAKLKAASEQSPDEYIIQVAYASLLEKVDEERAIAQYEKAIQVDASEQMAHYNLAALYVNQAVEISDQANSTDDSAEAQSLSREVEALFQLALPHMRKALAAKPDDLGALNALMQITVFLGLIDEYNTYVQQRKLLTGQ